MYLQLFHKGQYAPTYTSFGLLNVQHSLLVVHLTRLSTSNARRITAAEMKYMRITAGYTWAETLFPNWQKESWQTSEETSRYVRSERVNKWSNSMTDV